LLTHSSSSRAVASGSATKMTRAFLGPRTMRCYSCLIHMGHFTCMFP